MYDHTNDTESSKTVGIKPPGAGGHLKSKEKFLKWFGESWPIMQQLNQERVERAMNNLCWYNGQYDKAMEYRATLTGDREVKIAPKMVPVVVNHIFDLIEQGIARLSRFKSNIKTLPHSQEQADRVSADLVDSILKQINRMNKFDMKLQELQRWKSVFGEIFLDIEWDPLIGDKLEDGKRIGDVKYKITPSFYKFFEPCGRYEDARYCIEIHDIMHIDEVKISAELRPELCRYRS